MSNPARPPLQKCPFCGKLPEYIHVEQLDGRDTAEVQCLNDDCPVNPATVLFPTERQAASAWNKRVVSPQWAEWDDEGEDFHRGNITHRFRCSCCDYVIWGKPAGIGRVKYCLNCGSRMEVNHAGT